MLDFRKSLIDSTLPKVLKLLQYPLDSHADLRALVCGLPPEPSPHRWDDARARCYRGSRHRASLSNQDGAGAGGRVSPTQAPCGLDTT